MSTCRLYCWQWIIILIFLAAQIKDVKLLLDKEIFSFYALRSFFTKLYLIIYLNYFLSTGNTYQNSKLRSTIKIKVSISLSKCIRQVDVHAMFVIGFFILRNVKGKRIVSNGKCSTSAGICQFRTNIIISLYRCYDE